MRKQRKAGCNLLDSCPGIHGGCHLQFDLLVMSYTDQDETQIMKQMQALNKSHFNKSYLESFLQDTWHIKTEIRTKGKKAVEYKNDKPENSCKKKISINVCIWITLNGMVSNV